MSKTLLLADDSVVIQKLVGLSFANEDIEIVTVDNGDDAITRAIEVKPCMVLADVVMPGKSGYEVCEAIKQHPDLANTPVLLLTGTFEAFDESRAEQVGADGQITKPFEAQALVDRVTELLSQVAAPLDAPTPSPGSDFFAPNLGNLGDASEKPAESFSFGGGDNESSASESFSFGDPASNSQPLSAPLSATGDAMLEEQPSVAGEDRTIAMMPEDDPSLVSDPAVGTIFDDPARDAQIPGALDAPLLADDLRAAPAATTSDPAETVLHDDSFGGQTTAPIPEQAPSAGSDLDFEDLSFGTPLAPNETPAPDETVLAGELFGDAAAEPATATVIEETPALAPSNGLDLDFGRPESTPPVAESVTPSNVDPYDVSSSELDLEPFPAAPEWSETASVAEPEFAASPESDAPQLEAIPSVDSLAEPISEPATESAAIWERSEQSLSEPEPESSPTHEAIPVDEAAPSFEPVAVDDAAANTRTPDITPMMRERIQDTLEKVAWEAFSDLSETIVRQLLERVEQIAWEVIPQMAETLIQDEIRRMKGEGEDD